MYGQDDPSMSPIPIAAHDQAYYKKDVELLTHLDLPIPVV